jgi:hypothetical protein
MSKTLQKVKSSKSNLELTNKHCLISSIIHVGPSFATSGIVRVVGLHPRNIVNALERHMIANNPSIPLWSLSVRNHKIDGCTIDVKNVAIAWWASKTRVSPNKDDVMKK